MCARAAVLCASHGVTARRCVTITVCVTCVCVCVCATPAAVCHGVSRCATALCCASVWVWVRQSSRDGHPLAAGGGGNWPQLVGGAGPGGPGTEGGGAGPPWRRRWQWRTGACESRVTEFPGPWLLPAMFPFLPNSQHTRAPSPCPRSGRRYQCPTVLFFKFLNFWFFFESRLLHGGCLQPLPCF